MINLSGKAYIQYFRGIPTTRNQYDLQLGLELRGYQIIPVEIDVTNFSEFDPQTHPILKDFKREDILCSGIPVFRRVIKMLGIQYKEQETYPKVLTKFYGRTFKESTLGEVYSRICSNNWSPTFVKPKKQQKLFTGFVAASGMDFLKVAALDEATEIYTSEPVQMISEYRVYVNRENLYASNGIIGCHYYRGNPLIFPNKERVEEIINFFNLNGAPKAYGLDVAVISGSKRSKQNTIVVEVNGALQLGNYGMAPALYAEMLETAWKEF
jgi:hypothetical protein